MANVAIRCCSLNLIKFMTLTSAYLPNIYSDTFFVMGKIYLKQNDHRFKKKNLCAKNSIN